MKNKTINISIIIGLFIIIIIGLIIIIKPLRIYEYETFSNITNDYSNTIAINIENASGNYESSTNIPTSGYLLNTSNSFCGISNGDGTYTHDTSITMNYHDGVMFFGDMSARKTKCFLYFDVDKCGTACKSILANNTIDTSKVSGEFTSTFEEDTAGRIFEGPADDYGSTTYFFAGANPNNWVYFAGLYWRIIRVNGDGTLRLIYNGNDVTTAGTGTQISTSAFNTNYGDNMYVGYMYTSGSVHGLGTSSTIKGVLDTWYSNNLASYATYIDTNVGFCGDRQPSTSSTELNGSGGTGTTTTYYAPSIRVYSTHQFTYNCAESSDLYTVSSSSYGNKALTYPIGLITADEVAYAGGRGNTSNSSYWLYTNRDYWTMSPINYGDSNSSLFIINYEGGLYGSSVEKTLDVRPVINLKSSTAFSSGNGSSSSPYVV